METALLTPKVSPSGASFTATDSSEKLFFVASDGRPDSDPAFQLASLLAGTSGSVQGVAVVDQVNLVPESQITFSDEILTARRNDLRERVHAQMQRTLGRSVPFELFDGDPARIIAQTAFTAGATMILAGIGRHGVPARLFGNETVLRLMRLSELPVLAVARDMKHLPRRIVVAIDFSAASIRALRLAVSIAAPGATISLTHVGPRDSMLYDWDKTYKRNLLHALNELKGQLEQPAGVVFNSVLLQGDPATELLAHAKSLDADLIATGSHGHGFIARLIIGSVATRLIRGSGCSVLSVPQVTERAEQTSARTRGRTLVPAHWASLLDDVSRQNAGRLATLEVDGAELGAQVEARLVSFKGCSYDPYDGNVQLMLSASDDSREHLTHTASGVTSIDVLQDQLGRDVTLRIGHVGGQTLLSFRADSLDF